MVEATQSIHNYDLVRKIGVGAEGSIYLATDKGG